MPSLLGVFKNPGEAAAVVKQLRGRGYDEIETFCPAPFPELDDAVAHPRLHLEMDQATATVAVEPGLPLPDIDLPVTRYAEIGMYFGGVGAALLKANGDFQVAADPRREGGTCIAGG